jgi:hypothetical protein
MPQCFFPGVSSAACYCNLYENWSLLSRTYAISASSWFDPSVASLDLGERYLPSLASSRVILVGRDGDCGCHSWDGSDEQLEEDGEKRGKGASRWLHASWALLPGAEASSGGGR